MRIIVNECLKNDVLKLVCGIVLVFLRFRIIGKTIKTLGFHNKTHWLDRPSFPVLSRGVFRTLQTSNMAHFAKIVNDF